MASPIPETVRAFARDFANAPDLVAFPETETDSPRCSIGRRPRKSRSSVRRGLIRRRRGRAGVGDGFAGAVSLDMRHFDRVLEVDE